MVMLMRGWRKGGLGGCEWGLGVVGDGVVPFRVCIGFGRRRGSSRPLRRREVGSSVRGWSCAGYVRWRLEWVIRTVLESFVLRQLGQRWRENDMYFC